MISLDRPSALDSKDDAVISLKKNFDTLEKGVNRLGNNLLVSKQISSTQATGSATYVSLTEFAKGIVSSGGVCMISASINILSTAANFITTVGLFIDGKEYENVSGAGTQSLGLRGFVTLASGSHRVEFKFKNDGGTSTLNGTAGSISSLYIMEFPAP